ncbi:MAG: S41 family peptidase [Acidobacteria bacterium]|nr:S41 family peptidase [Acidobacteriota bacterium]MBI3423997.1 S41 family peptidase [Acidobacteriota bacterium]
MSRYFVIIASLILTAATVAGGLLGKQPTPLQPSDAMADNPVVRAFADALKLVEENHAALPDNERLTRGAVSKMLHTLDPHSSFFNRQEFNEMQDEQSSKFYGIGITVNQRNGRLYILGVNPGLPAEKAGLRYGDALLAVDGKPAKDWTHADALKHVRGNRGTTVEVTVERVVERTNERPAERNTERNLTKTLTFQIERDEIPYPSVRNRFMLRPDIGYIGLTGGFNQATSEELREAIAKLKKDGMTALVLDLRRNPGGLLKQAVQVAEIFLPTDSEIVSVKGARAPKQVYRSDNPEPETMPLAVLIDHETASASEIVAGAMQDQDRGLVVGSASFGKGLVQTVFRLPWGMGLTLTTAKYYTASGRSIQREYTGVSLYDYYREGIRPPAKFKPMPNSKEAFYTPTKRVLRGGGGITPDVLVNLPEEDWQLRDACFEFVRQLIAGMVPSLPEYKLAQPNYEYQLRGNEFPINEPILNALRGFWRERPKFRALETKLGEQTEYVRRRLRAELITAAYGVEAGEQFLMESDPQALHAIEELPKAKLLNERARLFKPSVSIRN